ncbi:hypothetical protein OC842_003596 [Tilletia horrida]|uniref:Uncharacterized protein n=1 Tax=Tilletia horrida TaxID=155126 RepID=A0AAN6GDN8_9BASI|nr:hypothetical protein OC842_003596 [Tilletia horrida]
MDPIAVSTTLPAAPPAASGSSSAMRIASLLDTIHDEASQAKLSTDSAIVLEASPASAGVGSGTGSAGGSSSSSSAFDPAASGAGGSVIVVQSPAPSNTNELHHALLDITRILKPIANGLRSDQEHKLRHSLGSSPNLPSAAVQLLQLTLEVDSSSSSSSSSSSAVSLDAALLDAQLHILRLFANLCIDAPANRAVLFAVHAPIAVVQLLASALTLPASALRGSPQDAAPSASTGGAPYPASKLPLLRTAVGALLNMQLAHEQTRAALRAHQPTIPLLAHLAYSPAIYPLNAVSALLASGHAPSSAGPSTSSSIGVEQSAGEFGLALAGLHAEADGEAALEDLQMRASIASWASQVLLDICSDRPQPASPSPEQVEGEQANGITEMIQGADADDKMDEEEDDDDDGEPEGEINADVVASQVPLSALILPLAAFLSSTKASTASSASSSTPASGTALARALTEDEDARLSLISTDIELLQNAVQFLEKAVLDAAVPEPVTPNPNLEPTLPDAADGANKATIRRRMLERAELVRAPWAASAESPGLGRWLASLAHELSLSASSSSASEAGAGGSDASTPTGVPAADSSIPSSQVSAECALALIMSFIQRGHAPLLAAAAQRSASSTSSLPDATAASAALDPTAALLTAGTSAGALLRAAAQSFVRCKSGLARVLVEVVGDDACMEALFDVGSSEKTNSTQGSGWFVDTLKRWMKADGGAVREDELQSTALLAMGNLARKDSHCIALVHQHNLAPFLVSLLPSSASPETSPANAPPSAASRRLSHSVLSLLKNLSIPAQNKPLIGELGVISRVANAGFLRTKDNIQQVQFAAVGLLKHLCRGEIACAIEVVLGRDPAAEPPTPALDALLALIAQTEDVPVRMEGTRVLVYVVKALWASSASKPISATAAAAVSPELVTRARAVLASTSASAQAVRNALARMIRSAGKYPVLVNEGVVALTLLASENAASAEGVAEALLTDSSASASGSGAGSGGKASTSSAPGSGAAIVAEPASILGGESQAQGGPASGAPAPPPIIMAEPESFVSAPPAGEGPSSSSTSEGTALSGPAPAHPAASPGAAGLRAGPVSSLLRTETANLGGGAGSGSGSGGLHEPHVAGPRRQSTAEAYVQAGLASAPGSSGLSALAPLARSPLAGAGASPSAMDIDSPTSPSSASAAASSSIPAVLGAGAGAGGAVGAPPNLQAPQAPVRRGSAHQQTASSLLTAPRPSALSMLDVVLGRRDARMPPLFASNAAVLVQMVSANTATATASGQGSSAPLVSGSTFEVARRTEEALERLVSDGPEEAKGAAREALDVVKRRLGKA